MLEKGAVSTSFTSDLGMERLHVDGRLRASVAAARTEHIGCPSSSCAFHDVI
jgi:hypothetical protein